MSAGKLTNAGRDLFAAKQGASQVLVIDRFMLANIPGLDPNDPVNLDEPIPAVGDQVATLAVTQAGYVNADKVVYSLYMGTTVGDFTFNWVGLLADDDTLVAVRYIDPITKYATVGQDLGNAITRNFLVTYTDAAAITNITVDANTWQLAFDAASTDNLGLVELATQTEMDTEADTARVPPVNVVAAYVAAKLATKIPDAPSDGEQYARENGAWVVVDAIPSGAVLMAFSSSPLPGTLELDGATLSRATYAALWAYAQASGNLVAQGSKQAGNFGDGDGSTTFTLPDMRGEFPRGWDHGRGVDTGRGIGTWQKGSIAAIDLLANGVYSASGPAGGSTTQALAGLDSISVGDYPGITVTGVTSTVSIALPGSTEGYSGASRPRNVALMFCIKY